MTLATNIFVSPARLILTPTNYSGGGTNLGEILDAEVAGVSLDYQLLQKQSANSQWFAARRLGANMVLTVTVAERSTSVVGFLFNSLATNGTAKSVNSTKPGKLLVSSEYAKLLVLPNDSAHPALYFPKALVTEVGAFIWSPSAGRHMDACKITVAAMFDSTLGEAWYYGATANFPSL